MRNARCWGTDFRIRDVMTIKSSKTATASYNSNTAKNFFFAVHFSRITKINYIDKKRSLWVFHENKSSASRDITTFPQLTIILVFRDIILHQLHPNIAWLRVILPSSWKRNKLRHLNHLWCMITNALTCHIVSAGVDSCICRWPVFTGFKI